jgi:hypothetical protein
MCSTTAYSKDFTMARGFARIDNQGQLVASKGVVGMRTAISGGQSIPFGAYCFKLEFTPLAILACSIAHPDDYTAGFYGPLWYTAGPNITGTVTSDQDGTPVQCVPGYQDAAVFGRSVGTGILRTPYGGVFVLFE